MRRNGLGLALSLAACTTLVLLVVPAALAATPAYPTTAVTATGIVQTTISGYQGVLVNYTSAFPTTFSGFVYLDLTNAAGQTVAWNVAYCGFSASAKAQCFVSIPLSTAAGSYNAHVFVATSTGVAVSATSSVKVTV
ncbi:MAG: hypothetical protein KGI26_05115 [Thaumarchaeota archaeon]|nr:hypothetical protein [Nitrososphaerota archaeon]